MQTAVNARFRSKIKSLDPKINPRITASTAHAQTMLLWIFAEAKTFQSSRPCYERFRCIQLYRAGVGSSQSPFFVPTRRPSLPSTPASANTPGSSGLDPISTDKSSVFVAPKKSKTSTGSAVWAHFIPGEDSTGKCSWCQVKKATISGICGHRVGGGYEIKINVH